MKAEKKKNTVSDKKIKLKLIARFFCTLITLIILILSFISFGWFTEGGPSNINLMTLSAEDDGFEIATAGEEGIYDSYISGVSKGSEIQVVDENSDHITLISSNGGEIKWKLSDDSNIGNYSENNTKDTSKGIQPGSSGKITFYVIAKRNGTLNVNFSLSTILYKENTATTIEEITDTTVTKLVKGHILFFEKFENSVYSNRINDSFNFIKENAVKDTAYKVDIYWIWPKVADQLILPKDDLLLTEENKRIVDDSIDIIGSDYDNFFVQTGTETVVSEEDFATMLENMKLGSDVEGFNEDYYKSLNDMWNIADQKIGTDVVYIELRLKAQKQTPTQE